LFARGRYVEQGTLLAGMAGIVTTDEQRVVVAVSRALGTFGVWPTARQPSASLSRPRQR
jgi:hypothetical protein